MKGSCLDQLSLLECGQDPALTDISSFQMRPNQTKNDDFLILKSCHCHVHQKKEK